MDKKLINKLNKLIIYLEDVVHVLKEIIAETEVSSLNKVPPTAKVDTVARELRQLSREQAKSLLESLNKKQQLEPLFRQLGGGSSEAKRPKVYVIDRILWYLFDVSK